MTLYNRTLAGFSRRELLKIACYLGAGAVGAPLATRRALAKPIFDSYPFTVGVASGDPLPDGVVLRTRLAPNPLEGGGMPMADVEVAGLEPARDYWYRFRAGDEVSRTGRTKTAPPAGAAVDRIRFAVCGCNNYEQGWFTAFRRIAEEQFDFVFHSGDYIYEGRASGGRSDAVVRQHNGHEPYTLVDYRNRYALYKMDRDLLAAHASAPWIVTWDDHEVDNNYAGDADEHGTPPEIF